MITRGLVQFKYLDIIVKLGKEDMYDAEGLVQSSQYLPHYVL